MDVTRQQHVAYHEAGHALVAHELGTTVHWIERNEDGSGRCNAKHLESEFDDGTIYIAGALAAALKFGRGHARPSPDDVLGMVNLSAEQIDQAMNRAMEILRRRWADVETLAQKLLDDPDGFVATPFAPDYSNL